MVSYRRYAVRCTTDDCGWRVQMNGPDLHAHAAAIRVLVRQHADLKHRGVRHPTAMVASLDNPGDHAEVVL